MYGRTRTRQGPPKSMNDDSPPATLGLTDAELAVHPTVFAGGQLWGETWTTGKPAYFGGDGK